MKTTFLRRTLIVASLLMAVTLGRAADKGYVNVSGGGRIYYEAEGEGTPVVLLHGHTLDLRMWDPQMAALTKSYRVIRPEFRGYGHSTDQREGMQFTYVDDIMTLLDSLHLDKIHLVGLSMGSFVASEIVAMHPERLLSATLASGNIKKCKGPSTPPDSAELATRANQIAEAKAKGLEAWKKEWIEKLVSGGGSNREAIRKSVTEQVNAWNGWQLLHYEARIYYGNEAWSQLKAKRPEVPTLILSGENEHKGKNPMLPHLPNGRIIVIKDCGHMTNMEKPDEFTALLLEQFKLGEEAQKQ